ncbi:MAG: sigma-54 interaction domain-containing protein [Syntrophobacteraceae bacterium]
MDEQEMNRHLKEIINTMNDGVVLVSQDGAILMVNRALEQITGYSREELLGRQCSIFHCDACERVRAGGRSRWCELFDLGHAQKKACALMRKDGSYVHVLKNASLLKDEAGIVLGAVETITDISPIEQRDEKIEQLSKLLEVDSTFHGMVGKSQAMNRVFEIIRKAAQSEAPVIIHGETGTGKELVAHAIHNLGRRCDKPYIQLNCAALNEALLESELFGHVKGAFTGAYIHRKGRFEAANDGDIFLDEIGDIPLSIQVKLLRILETKQIERVGDHQPIRVDVRIITATNRNLDQLISQGSFREDFFFRINIVPIHLPPLRDRTEDIPLLVEHFIRKLSVKSGKNISGLSPESMNLFMGHLWPGNVRELRGALEYAFVVAEQGQIRPEHLPVRVSRPESIQRNVSPLSGLASSGEKQALIDALVNCSGNQTKAALELGINRVTVWHRIKKYGIDINELLAPLDEHHTGGCR